MTTADPAATLAELARAHRDKDAAAIAACFLPNATIFDLAPPLSHSGVSQHGIAEWLATWNGPVVIDTAQVATTAAGDLAVAAGPVRMTGTKTDGVRVELWYRATYVLRRIGENWRIAHEHASVPFYMDGSFRAAVDLTPADDARRFDIT